MGREYAIYDVFTTEALGGNPLAVVFDGSGLDTDEMQRIAGEFNLSETVFVGPPENDVHTANLRIFTPKSELPFAGHPTVGTAVALAEQRYDGNGTPDAALFTLEEQIGLIRAAVSRTEEGLFAEFDLPKLPERLPFDKDKDLVAAALGLDPHEVTFENHEVSLWSAGVPFLMVPVSGLDAADKAALDIRLWLEIFDGGEGFRSPPPYIYCRDTVHHDSAFHARMYAGHVGIPEDPATGGAAAAFAGAIAHFDEPVDGSTVIVVEQGLEMGRPSFIRLELDINGGKIDAARIGGHAVKIAEGTLLI